MTKGQNLAELKGLRMVIFDATYIQLCIRGGCGVELIAFLS